jgi:hypothetical protein
MLRCVVNVISGLGVEPDAMLGVERLVLDSYFFAVFSVSW